MPQRRWRKHASFGARFGVGCNLIDVVTRVNVDADDDGLE